MSHGSPDHPVFRQRVFPSERALAHSPEFMIRNRGFSRSDTKENVPSETMGHFYNLEITNCDFKIVAFFAGSADPGHLEDLRLTDSVLPEHLRRRGSST
jgi:hypothetical protein